MARPVTARPSVPDLARILVVAGCIAPDVPDAAVEQAAVAPASPEAPSPFTHLLCANDVFAAAILV